MNRSKLPSDVGPLDPRFREWIKQFVETAVRPRSVQNYTFAAANTEYRIRHNLPNKPTQYVVVDRDAAGHVYTSQKADKYYVYLKSDTAGLTVSIEFS